MKYLATMEYEARIKVIFESDATAWRVLQGQAVEQAHLQGLIPDGWLSISYPLVTNVDEKKGDE